MKRTKTEILVDILKVTLESTGPTNIMYKVNTSWKPLTVYLDKLSSNGLIELSHVNGRRRYKITEKGISLLKLSENVDKALHRTPSGNP